MLHRSVFWKDLFRAEPESVFEFGPASPFHLNLSLSDVTTPPSWRYIFAKSCAVKSLRSVDQIPAWCSVEDERLG